MVSYDVKTRFFKLSGHVRSPALQPDDVNRHWDSRLSWHGRKSDHFFLDDVAYASGKRSAYFPVTKELGIKVGFGPRRGTVRHDSHICRQYRITMRHMRAGLGPTCHGMVKGAMDVTMPDGRYIGVEAHGLLMTTAQRPPNSRYKIVGGRREYDFDTVDRSVHPLHSAEGYAAFVQEIRRAIARGRIALYQKSSRVAMCELGQICYCMAQKRWFLVDCGA